MEAIPSKYGIKAKYFPGVIEGCRDHYQTVNKGRSFVRGLLNGLEQVKRGGKDIGVAVGYQNIAGFISFQQSIAGENCILSTNIVSNAVERFCQHLGG